MFHHFLQSAFNDHSAAVSAIYQYYTAILHEVTLLFDKSFSWIEIFSSRKCTRRLDSVPCASTSSPLASSSRKWVVLEKVSLLFSTPWKYTCTETARFSVGVQHVFKPSQQLWTTNGAPDRRLRHVAKLSALDQRECRQFTRARPCDSHDQVRLSATFASSWEKKINYVLQGSIWKDLAAWTRKVSN